MPFNPTALTDGEVRATLVQMAQAITALAQDITAHATRERSPRDNPHASTMVSRLRYFTRMNPQVYFEYRTNEDPQEVLDDFYNILCAMGFK